MNVQRFETEWGGKTLIIETGHFAQAAHGQCTVQYGETIVMGTATMSENVREGMNWFPLMVEFEEKLYAAGRIKGSRFMKKEGRPTDEAVLNGRMIDRGIRPLFDDTMRNDIQVITTVLQFDGVNDPGTLGIIAASCALHMSKIPWEGPLAGARIGHIDGEFVLNPSYEQRETSLIDLSIAGTPERLLMVEAGANECPDDLAVEAFEFGMKQLAEPLKLIKEVQAAIGVKKYDPRTGSSEVEIEKKATKEKVIAIAKPFVLEGIQRLFFDAPQATKTERRDAKDTLKGEVKVFLEEQGVDPDDMRYGTGIIETTLEAEVAREIVENDKRVDGRALDEIRELEVEVGLFSRLHGSGHFKRGETQVLSMLTLGSPGDEQTLDGMEVTGTKRFMHHYNFAPYSVGEVKPMRGPGRREIGHGALAEKALKPMIPSKEDFPYTIRVVSETLMSNGSSSMGSTCGCTLALMDAGVPIKAPVAGLAMGLASHDGKWKVLTDLQDLEDGKGGMDFKIAGTREGLTAIQMDTKTEGLTMDIIRDTFGKAKVGRLHILDKMDSVIPEPRAELSQFAPRIVTIRINPELIGAVIGPGGKMINEIIDTTGVSAIDIEDDGLVMITSVDATGSDKAVQWVKDLTREIKAGEEFKGKVVRLMDFGAFVELLPGKDGLVHVSELAPWRVEKVGDIVNVGDEVFVKVKEIDDMGRINLTMKGAAGNDYTKFKRPESKPFDKRGSDDKRPPRGPRKPFDKK